MENLHLKSDLNLPVVIFNADTGILNITGSFLTNNPIFYLFFRQMHEWTDEYFKSPAEYTIANVKLYIVNTSGQLRLLDFFNTLDHYYKKGHKVIVNWYYDKGEKMDDGGLLELGDDYKDLMNLPFNLIEK